MKIGNTFRGKLLTSFLLLSAFTILTIIIYCLYFLRKKDLINESLMMFTDLKVSYIQDIRLLSDFIRFDALDTSFHIMGTSKNLEAHKSVNKRTDEILASIRKSRFTSRLNIQSDLDSLEYLRKAMKMEFDEIVTNIRIRGFKDYGVEGEMRKYAHLLESSGTNKELLLSMRRHEKDYIIRKEPQYIDKLNRSGSELMNRIQSTEKMVPPYKDSLIELATNYIQRFNYLVAIEEKIGLYKNSGIKQDLESIFSKSETVINRIAEKGNLEKDIMIRRLELNAFWFFSLLILVNVLISVFLSTFITNPLRDLTVFVSNITRNNFSSDKLQSIRYADHEIKILLSEFSKMMEYLYAREAERDEAERALRENETKYRNLADLLPQSIFETDKECVLTYYNRTMADTFGLNESVTVSGLKITDILNTDCETLLNKEHSSSGTDFIARKKDGEEFPVLLYVTSIRKYDELEGMRGIIVDITEKIRYTEELKEQKAKAEQADKLKSAFLANMSHEIRTPMNSIVGFSQILTQPDLDQESRQEYAGYISNSSDLLLKIINDILDVARLESGQFKVSYSDFNLNMLMNKIAVQTNEMKRNRNKSHIAIRVFKYYENKDFCINSDQHRLEQVLINLVSNAIKFTHQGLIEVGYRISDKKILEFFVKDTGIGIPPDKIDIVFERFTQVEEVNNKQYEGTGLGLSICKSIVELLGGRIWVDSIPGTGSVFSFEIPLLNNSFVIEEEVSIPQVACTSELFEGVKLLIAEDVEFNYLFLREGLKPYKMKILRAVNGEEAVNIIAEDPDIPVVLMDMRMLVMDGYEATKRIKNINSSIRIIATTAYAISGEKEKCIEAGCDNYVSKPIQIRHLIDIIGKYIVAYSDKKLSLTS